jgi:prophage tail gpP-like protein
MALSDSLGGIDDAVTIKIANEGTTRIVESYDVRHSILEQPAVFALRTGWGDVAELLIDLAKPRAKYTLSIGGVLQQTGLLDGPQASDNARSGAQVTMHGRDALSELHDAYIPADRSFGDISYADLAFTVLQETTNRTFVLKSTNRSNRELITGAKITVAGDDDVAAAIARAKAKENTAKAGEKWYDFLKKELDRAGLFLIATADGEFALISPQVNQVPIARIYRPERDGSRVTVSATDVRYKNISTGRHAEYRVLGRGGGGPPSAQPTEEQLPRRYHLEGIFVDQEMIDWGYSRKTRCRTFKDAHCTTQAQADYLARKKCAEARRAGWELVYTVAGHTTQALRGGGRIVWAVDTMVEVVDERLGIAGAFYVEAVTFRRGPEGTTTEIQLMRPEDVVFGEPQ